MLPSDPIILLSYINTHLRDDGVNLEDLCDRLDVSQDDIVKKLAEAGFTYQPEQNCFR